MSIDFTKQGLTIYHPDGVNIPQLGNGISTPVTVIASVSGASTGNVTLTLYTIDDIAFCFISTFITTITNAGIGLNITSIPSEFRPIIRCDVPITVYHDDIIEAGFATIWTGGTIEIHPAPYPIGFTLNNNDNGWNGPLLIYKYK